MWSTTKIAIKDDFDGVAKFVKDTPDPQVAKKQNIEKENAELRKKQLIKSGVQYSNPQQVLQTA